MRNHSPVSDPSANRSPSVLPQGVLRYGVALVSVGAALLLMAGLGHLSGGYDGRPALLVAVTVSALYGGVGPGLVAVALSGLAVRDPVILIAGAILSLMCAWYRRSGLVPASTGGPSIDLESLPVAGISPGQPEAQDSPVPLPAATTEATWRFQHEQPLDITLPEDEQVEHLYLYSVLAECNDSFARMYGFRTAGDVVGTRLVVFLPPSNPENVAYLRTFIRSGYRLEDAESHEIDRYGRAKYFVNNLVGIFERGHLVGAWGTQRDVTDRKRREDSQEYSSRLHSTKSSSQ
jgi:PAS domain-containing protein